MTIQLRRRRVRRRVRQPPPLSVRPMNRMASGARLSSEFLDDTIREWQPYSREPLTREDAREIIFNVTGFMHILMRWERAARQSTERKPRRVRSESATNSDLKDFD
jgi:hypothetical protein